MRPSTFEWGSLSDLEFAGQARLAGYSAPRILLSLPPQGWDYSHLLLCILMWMIEIDVGGIGEMAQWLRD